MDSPFKKYKTLKDLKSDKPIKNSHILIIGSGHSLKEYNKKIKKFIKNNDVITFGCNYIADFIIPDYHFWGDPRRYILYGKSINQKSIAVFSRNIPLNVRKRNWKKKYISIDYGRYSDKKELEYSYSNRKCRETIKWDVRFRTIGCLAILYAFLNKASKISIVGMDGYTLYSKEDLDKGSITQHWYNIDKNYIPKGCKDEYKDSGYTDVINFYNENEDISKRKKENKDDFYGHCLKKDEEIYTCLKRMNGYGIEFEIITPTVYKEFYRGIL